MTRDTKICIATFTASLLVLGCGVWVALATYVPGCECVEGGP